MDKYPITARSLEKFYKINGDQFERQYKEHLSDFNQWREKSHAEDWLVFPGNIGPYLSIDETSLSNGELYTIVTNKSARGQKGAIVAIIKGTKSDDIIKYLKNISFKKRKKVIEVTLDMANSMEKIVKSSFPRARLVIDRFHVQKLACDALQSMRIAHRWDAINYETNERERAKLEKGYTPKIETFSNGDSLKQLLARSRYLLFKSADKWSVSQKLRAKILFEKYSDIKRAYWLVHKLRVIYNSTNCKSTGLTKLAHWYNDVTEFNNSAFNTVSATIYTHYTEILNFFFKRSTNASAESFNAKIKQFRASLHGVVDIKFFLYRLTKIYA